MLDMNSSRVQRTTEQIACDMDGEVVVLDLKSGIYYGLDTVGARIWNLIEQPMALAAIREVIMSEYDVSQADCDRDIMAFVQKMREVGLVDVSSESHP
jgi:hypothetical protein